MWEPVFYGDLVYKLKIIFGKPKFSDQFKKIIERNKSWIYTKHGYQTIVHMPGCNANSYGIHFS